MYVPPQFAPNDPEAALRLIRQEPFGMLISVVKGEPLVTHIPFSIVTTEPKLVLSGHVAIANPHWRDLHNRNVLVVFRGPHGFISPRWYGNQNRNVPTWNYMVVHCSGMAALAPDEDKGTILAALTGEMEGHGEQAWHIGMLDPDYREQSLRAIVGFYVTVHSLHPKFKLSQNRSEQDRAGVIAALRKCDRNSGNGLADAMSTAFLRYRRV